MIDIPIVCMQTLADIAYTKHFCHASGFILSHYKVVSSLTVVSENRPDHGQFVRGVDQIIIA